MRWIKIIYWKLPLSMKMMLWFVIIGIMFLILASVAAYVHRPSQIKALETYCTIFDSLQHSLVNVEEFPSGRNWQIYNYQFTYKELENEDILNLLKTKNIVWRKVDYRYLIGIDSDDYMEIKIENKYEGRIKFIIVTVSFDR